jgi:AcrR family transcriptional regulator
MKGYFLTAAKELIRSEGLKVVSARNVAEKAGFSYATLYNYFKDIRDLIFSCVEDFMGECRDFVAKEVPKTGSGAVALTDISKSYAKFFIQYPGIFDLFHQEETNQISTPKSNFSEIDAFFDSLASGEWEIIGKQKKAAAGEIAKAREFHKLALHGFLLFYLNKRISPKYNDVMDTIAELTRFAVRSIS